VLEVTVPRFFTEPEEFDKTRVNEPKKEKKKKEVEYSRQYRNQMVRKMMEE
jgi:hypothetical protein